MLKTQHKHKKTLLSLCLAFLCIQFSIAQNQEKYSALVQEASQLFSAKEYKQSAKAYMDAFSQIDGKAYPRDRYKAACSYALAGDL
ncbi:MAG: hypothetical protein ACI849_000013 [Patiriisocius sp.]|jgi:hypothetical protein